MHEPGAAPAQMQRQAHLFEHDLGTPSGLPDHVQPEPRGVAVSERFKQARGVASPAAQLRGTGVAPVDRVPSAQT
jgi:hypothetical protein